MNHLTPDLRAALSSRRLAAREAFRGWLDSDGFQEGADGCSDIIGIVWGDDTVQLWLDEWNADQRRKGMEEASAKS